MVGGIVMKLMEKSMYYLLTERRDGMNMSKAGEQVQIGVRQGGAECTTALIPNSKKDVRSSTMECKNFKGIIISMIIIEEMYTSILTFFSQNSACHAGDYGRRRHHYRYRKILPLA